MKQARKKPLDERLIEDLLDDLSCIPGDDIWEKLLFLGDEADTRERLIQLERLLTERPSLMFRLNGTALSYSQIHEALLAHEVTNR